MISSNLFKELNCDELHNIIGTHFGMERRFGYKLLDGGLFNTTYLITFLPDENKLVLRVGPVNRYLLLPFEHNLMNGEKYAYELCKNIGVPCSDVVVCDTSKTLCDRDYMIVTYIPSVALANIQLPADVTKNLYRQTGIYTHKMHEMTNDRFGRISDISRGIGYDSWSGYLKNEVAQWAGKVIDINLYDTDEIGFIKEMLCRYSDILDEIGTAHLVHCDLWEGNVLISGKDDIYNVAAIIDMDRATFGDPDLEFASLWMINDAFIEGYGKAPDTDEHHVLRRKIYQLLFNLLDSYIWFAQYNDTEKSKKKKQNALNLINELISF